MLDDLMELKRKGASDESRLEEKVKEAIRKNIQKYIVEEAIISQSGERTVKIPVKGLELPRFRYGNNQGGEGLGSGRGDAAEGDTVGEPGDEAGQDTGEHAYETEVEVDDIVNIAFEELGLPDLRDMDNDKLAGRKLVFETVRKAGPMSRLDTKRTLRVNIKRNAMGGSPVIGTIVRDDLRFKSFDDKPVPRNNALILCMMDVSGSMDQKKKFLVRTTLWWIKRYLQLKYDGLAFEFIIHDTESRLVDERAFFNISTGGGTSISSAFKLAWEVIQQNYDAQKWNIYPFYFSDGENWEPDNKDAIEFANILVEASRMFYYGQVAAGSWAKFKDILREGVIDQDRLAIAEIDDKDAVMRAIKLFLDMGG